MSSILSYRTVEQLLASGRGRGIYGYCRDGVGDGISPEQIPGIADKPRSSGMVQIDERMWVVWGGGRTLYYSSASEARVILQRARERARNGRAEVSSPPPGEGPQSEVPHVGVEIECCVPLSAMGRLCRLLSAIRGVGVASDGSIRAPEGHASVEVRVCGPEGAEIGRRVSLVCAVLRACQAVVNQSCGLHVHIDARPIVGVGRSGEEVWSRLMKCQGLLLAMQPKSRRENNYCRPTRGKDWQYASGRKGGGRARRYRAINALSYRAHKTIEVRCHTGTIRSNKILAWVELLVRIATGAAGPGGVRPSKKSLRSLGLSEATMGYVLARLELYGPKRWRELALRGQVGGFFRPIVALPPREEDQGEYQGDLAAA